MKRDIRFPTVNFRMAVMDLCELTGLTEREMLENIYEHLERFFTEHPKRKDWPIYFECEEYRIPHTSALSILWGIKEGILNWNHLVNIDEYGARIPETKAIAFEHFYVRLPDLLLFLSRVLYRDSDDLEKLRGQWKHCLAYDAARVGAAPNAESPSHAVPGEDPLHIFREMQNLQPEELELTFVSGDRLKITARGETRYAPLGSVGLVDSRSGNPAKGQIILIGFADRKPLPDTPANAKAVSRLRQHFFKAQLGVTIDPFHSGGQANWQPRFFVEDRRSASDERARREAKHIEFNDAFGHGSDLAFSEEHDEGSNWLKENDPHAPKS